MKKQNFTLIELLIVIAIIAILAGLSFSVYTTMQERGKITETKQTVNAVKTAIIAFRSDYQYMPSVGGDDNSDESASLLPWKTNEYMGSMKADSSYTSFFQVLCNTGKNASDKKPSATAQKLNPRSVRYLAPPENYFSDSDYENSVRDSWGNLLAVLMDGDGDGSVEIPSDIYKVNGKGVNDIYTGEVIVLSLGSQDAGKKIGDAEPSSYISTF